MQNPIPTDSLKHHEVPERRAEQAVRGVITKLLGNDPETETIVHIAMAAGNTTLSRAKHAADLCIDRLLVNNTIAEATISFENEPEAKWDDLFRDCDNCTNMDCLCEPESTEEGPSLAQQAHDIVNERGEEAARTYGPFSEGMARAAQIFSGATGIAVEGRHMYMALVALKLSRQSYHHKDDNLLDAMAYLQGLANLENGKA